MYNSVLEEGFTNRYYKSFYMSKNIKNLNTQEEF